MNRKGKVLFSLAVAFLMMATVIPVQNTGDVCAYGEEPQLYGEKDTGNDAGHELKEVDNGDGTYSMYVPFLLNRFGLGPQIPEPGDPACGTLGKIVPEIHTFYGKNSDSKVMEPDGKYLSAGNTVTSGMVCGVEFSLGFSTEYEKTGVEDVFTYGITTGGTWFVQNTKDTHDYPMYASDSAYLNNLISDMTSGKISKAQSSNVLPYAIGNFTDDETEEFAVYLGDRVTIFDNSYDNGDWPWPVADIPIENNPYGTRDMVNPVSMTSGDVDGDGIDEIVMAVEYSDNHSDSYSCSMGSHCTYIYLMSRSGSGSWSTECSLMHVNTHNENLDTVMTSVCTVDYDFDCRDEIVAGGYLWDNGRHDDESCRWPNYFTGELYLCSVEPDAIGTGGFSMNNLHRLLDDADSPNPHSEYVQLDCDLHATNGSEDSIDDRDYVDEHHVGDTSILLQDGWDDEYGYCQSPNWTNWTIPMATVHFRSAAEQPFIYFDNCVYPIDCDGDLSYWCAIPLNYYQDNNNCQCVCIETGNLIYRAGMESISFDDLYRFVATDRQSGHGTNQYWTHEINYLNMGDDDRSTDDDFIDHKTIEEREYTGEVVLEPFMACLTDFDPSDKVDVKFMGAIGSFTDPTVIAAISGIPYDSDLPECLKGGAPDIGYTTYTNASTTSSTDTTNVQLQVDFTGDFNVWFNEASVKAGFNFGKDWIKVHDVTIDTGYEATEDSVAVYMVPFDAYVYKVIRTDGTEDAEQIYRWYDPMQIIMSYEKYCDMMQEYNSIMLKNCEGFVPADILPESVFDHTPGDIASYNEHKFADPKKFLIYEAVEYSGDDYSGHKKVGVSIDDGTGKTMTYGGNLNLSYMRHGIKNFMNLGYEENAQATYAETTMNVTEMGFQSYLAQGLYSSYDWGDEMSRNDREAEAMEVMSQYGMKGHIWAKEETINDSPYIHMGYTVDYSTSACKYGWMEAKIQNLEEKDSRDPDEDSLYMLVHIPGDARTDLLADKYVLQMLYQGKWNDWTLMGNLGVGFQMEEGPNGSGNTKLVELCDSFLIEKDKNGNAVDPTEKAYWVKVTGLKDLVKDNSYSFRLMGYSHDLEGNIRYHPGPVTEAFTSQRSIDVTVQMTDDFLMDNGGLLIPHIQGIDGDTRLLLKTDLDPGTLIDICYEYGDGSVAHFKNRMVNFGGDVVLDINDEVKEKDPVPVGVTILVFVGILACLGAGAYVLRKP